MSRKLFAASGERETLTTIVEVAVANIEGCDFSSIFIVDGGTLTTPARTAHRFAEADALQQRTGDGPCLEAVHQRVAVYSPDLLDECRWRQFAAAATSRGVRSVLALPLQGDDTIGALNLYSRYPMAFGVVDRAKAVLVAGLAAIALAAARAHDAEERRAEDLQAALVTRELIGQAQGILMERERITAEEAFRILRQASQHLNRKLRDVAQALVETGEAPHIDRTRS